MMRCDEGQEPWELTMYGGYSYSVGEPETFATVREACEAWADRRASNGTRKVDGVYWPTWGDMADDDYAIANENDGLTRAQVLAVADGGPMPWGWGECVFDTVRGRMNAARHCLYCQAISLDWDDVAPTHETGCYIDGHWGQYGTARIIEIAADFGWVDEEASTLAAKHLASMGPSTSPDLTDDEYDRLIDAADDAEAWLNDNAADDEHYWGWDDGELFYRHVSEDNDD